MILISAPRHAAAAQEAGHVVVPAAEAEFISLINDLRISRGVPALEVHDELVVIARSWAGEMARTGRISHNPNFAQQVTADWQRLGENVGMGGDVSAIHEAFVASEPHLRNLVDPAYSLVGVGVVRTSDGILYTSHQFMELRVSAAPAPSPAPRQEAAHRPQTAARGVPARARPPTDAPIPATPPQPEDVIPVSSVPVTDEQGDRIRQDRGPRPQPPAALAAASQAIDWVDPMRVAAAVLIAGAVLTAALTTQRRRRRSRSSDAAESAELADQRFAATEAASLAGWTTGLHWRRATDVPPAADSTGLDARLAAYSARWAPHVASAGEQFHPAPEQSEPPDAAPLWIRLGEGDVITDASDAFAASLGYRTDELAGWRVTDLIHPADRDGLDGLRAPANTPRTSGGVPARFRHRDGSWRHLEISPVSDADDWVLMRVIDITERSAVEAALRHHAYHDRATGLPGRLALTGWLAECAARGVLQATVVLVEVSGLESIRATTGHAAAERLLVAVGERVRAAATEADFVARIAESEFLLARHGHLSEGDARGIAADVVTAARRPVATMSGDAGVSCTGGVALLSGAHLDADEAIRHAYVAMGVARRRRDLVAVFRPEHDVYASASRAVDADNEIRTDELVLHYQPIIDLRTGVVAGLEALLRWHQPGRGLLGPGEFLPRAEAAGSRTEVTDWVIEEACQTLRYFDQRRSDPGGDVYVSVNIGARDLQDPTLPVRIGAALATSGAQPDGLIVEITEAEMLGDDRTTTETLRSIKDAGVRLAVDDFGTGFSTLSNLKRVPADLLKIDRSLVRDLGQSSSGDPIVTAVIGMARMLGLTTVGEGVETPAQLGELRAAGCDCVQGYLYAPPLPLAAASELVKSGVSPEGEAVLQPS